MQSEDLEITRQVPSIMKPDSTTRFMDLAFMNSMGGSVFACMNSVEDQGIPRLSNLEFNSYMRPQIT